MPRTSQITRSITTTACIGQHVNQYGEFEDFCDVTSFPTTEEKASKYFRRKYNDQSITINKVEQETHVYYMSVEEFIACAHERVKEN